tara:strand:- start:322 stop:447 length:126 start_codon:yes stop_codon:yes gene_type:complete
MNRINENNGTKKLFVASKINNHKIVAAILAHVPGANGSLPM